MPLSNSDRFQIVALSFVGAGVFWAISHSQPALAQVVQSIPFVKLQATTPGSTEAGNAHLSGKIMAGQFAGNGAEITALSADNLASGTVADARLGANLPRLGLSNVFTGANTFSNTANNFSGSGQLLTSLNASNLSSGTIPDARIVISGDLTGPLSANKVSRIQGITVGNTPPTVGDVFGFDGSKWTPARDGLSLPFTRSLGSTSTLFSLTNTNGTSIDAEASVATGPAIMATYGSTAVSPDHESAIYATSSNTSGTAIVGEAAGVGRAARFIRGSNFVDIEGVFQSVNTDGFYWKQYTSSVTANTVPVAYGCITTTGAVAGGTGNFTVTKVGTGVYDIAISGINYTHNLCSCIVTPNSNSPRFGTVATNGGLLRVNIWTNAGVAVDAQFQFTLFKTTPETKG